MIELNKYLSQVIRKNSIEVRFKDITPEDYLFDCYKYNEEPHCLIEIFVKNSKDKKGIAKYRREFDSYPHQFYYHNFVTKFLADSIKGRRFFLSKNSIAGFPNDFPLAIRISWEITPPVKTEFATSLVRT